MCVCEFYCPLLVCAYEDVKVLQLRINGILTTVSIINNRLWGSK